MRSRVSSGLSYVYNFPALDPSLVLYYPLDTSANINGGFTTPNFASRLPVYDASLAGSSMITYNPGTFITSLGDLSLNNTMGSQLVAQTASGNYVVCNNTVALNISGGFSISLWFSCSGQLNTRGTLFALPYNKTGNGFEIDVSGTNMIYTGYNVPIPSPIDSLSASAKTAMLYSGTRKQAGAYGVRLLNSNYTGPIMQIKAGTSGTPTNFFGDVNGNLSTASSTSLTTFLGGQTAYITKWYDQTGNSNDATAVNTPIFNNTTKTVDFSSGYFSLLDSSFPLGNSPYTYIFTPNNYTLTTNKAMIVYSGGPHNSQCGDCAGMLSYANYSYANLWFNSSWLTTYQTDTLRGTKIADCYDGTNASGRSFYFNNQIETNSRVDQINDLPRTQTGQNCYLGYINFYDSFNLNYNGTLQFFYWAPVQLSQNDLTILCNT